MLKIILDGIMGLAVADALGVPVEFNDRKSLVNNPVVGMRSYGTHNQPAGTWSDDTSMTLCLVDSLTKGLDYDDIMNNFSKWFNDGDYTPHGESFDIGNTTRESIARYDDGVAPLECGGKNEYDNGNGSLMRILPILFYLKNAYGCDFLKKEITFDIIHNVSSLTHAHKRSQMACGIYISVASRLIDGSDLIHDVNLGIQRAMDYYRKKTEFKSELIYFNRIEDANFKNFGVDEINSGGYVVDTLEAALWCLLKTSDYMTCVLKAVNLGDDTDTTAAVAGSLAGIKYGNDSIPNEWKLIIKNKKYIEELCSKLNRALTHKSLNF